MITTATSEIATVKVGDHPYYVTVSGDGKFAYVTNTQGDNVSVIDTRLRKVINRIDVGEVPEGISYDTASGKIIVANWGSDSVSIINGLSTQPENIATGKQSRAFGNFILQSGPETK